MGIILALMTVVLTAQKLGHCNTKRVFINWHASSIRTGLDQ
jgi:hypothetical protein